MTLYSRHKAIQAKGNIVIERLVEWFGRMFQTCDGNNCGGYTDNDLLFVEDANGLFPIELHAGYPIYVYYCPWCGKRMRTTRTDKRQLC